MIRSTPHTIPLAISGGSVTPSGASPKLALTTSSKIRRVRRIRANAAGPAPRTSTSTSRAALGSSTTSAA